MRICIELRRDVNANVILNQLYKHTQLQDTFGVIMLALVNNEPKVMNILDMINTSVLGALGCDMEPSSDISRRQRPFTVLS